MEESDRILLRRFVRDEDGEAFSILMQRYADMVYSTCRRVLDNDALASDAVQETFFQFIKQAEHINGSLAGWLHRVATRRAVDLVRSNVSRRRRERSYALELDNDSGAWTEVQGQVDEALEELPDTLREVLVLHFLERRSTTQIAAAQGVSQPTISRRVAEALERMRDLLREKGVALSVVPLQGLLLHYAHCAPESLLRSLGKIGLARAVSGKTPYALFTTGAKAVLAGGALVILAVSLRPMLPGRAGMAKPVLVQPAVATSAPAMAASTTAHADSKASSAPSRAATAEIAQTSTGSYQSRIPGWTRRNTGAPKPQTSLAPAAAPKMGPATLPAGTVVSSSPPGWGNGLPTPTVSQGATWNMPPWRPAWFSAPAAPRSTPATPSAPALPYPGTIRPRIYSLIKTRTTGFGASWYNRAAPAPPNPFYAFRAFNAPSAGAPPSPERLSGLNFPHKWASSAP
jgi:RNA polymerase sigma factor (sigma-70 family)